MVAVAAVEEEGVEEVIVAVAVIVDACCSSYTHYLFRNFVFVVNWLLFLLRVMP